MQNNDVDSTEMYSFIILIESLSILIILFIATRYYWLSSW